MADSDNNEKKLSKDDEEFVKDPRIVCRYGAKCYQKNPTHLKNYKHPSNYKRVAQRQNVIPPKKKFKLDEDTIQKGEQKKKAVIQETLGSLNMNNDLNEDEKNSRNNDNLERTPKNVDVEKFIEEKFLVKMPSDFFEFWKLCTTLNKNKPEEAFRDVGLTLVGPYDVLAGKFNDVLEQPAENYLVHWRFYYDPPECQTVLIGDNKGYHIGYYRDSPKDLPEFLVSNSEEVDGTFQIMGDNIFTAVYLYLENFKKTGDIFKKMNVGNFQLKIKRKIDELQLDLSDRSDKIRKRERKTITKSFSKLGFIVPYNRKTQVGYRPLCISNKDLVKLLTDIQIGIPEKKQSLLSKFQNILTNVNIATDECDFGTGIELGLDILAHGVDCLNRTVSRCLATNYRLINKEEFAKIVEAHMKNRKRGSKFKLSIISETS
ncbi:hypothetical protein ABEB36_005684 [Hypothenemus hampei]|uniref:PBZ-type domain-containing protein n=1 Tax=Hypothenemus hampei TaxID=57062 RepID=A0ABD1EZ32_HYPHA